MDIAIIYNEPVLQPDHPYYASEAGVLDSVHAIDLALREAGHRVAAAAIESEPKMLWRTLSTLQADAIVNLVEGFAGHSSLESHVAGCLELTGIPYTGSPSECLALVHDKVRTKRLLLGSGLATAPFWSLEPKAELPLGELITALELGPLFVKPANEDASLGIGPASVVFELAALQTQVAALQARFGTVLVERYLAGREFNVSVIALQELTVLPLAEIEFQPDMGHALPIVTYESKWAQGSLADRATAPRCPAIVEPDLAQRLRELARAAFLVTGCRDYARIDLRTNSLGEPFILEVNGNPDLGPEAGFARAISAHGWSYAEFAQRLIATALLRKE